MERYPVRKLFLRGLATAFTSLGCSRLIIRNKIGDVYAISFLLAIDDVSTFKSPPLFALRRLIVNYSRELLDPAKFTPPGFVEHVCGAKKRKGMEATKPHPIGMILRDEISKINAEKVQSGFGAILAFLCELWNGWIEGARTRSYGIEGGLKTYHSLTATSNYHFLKTLDDDFWIIGLGARTLLLTNLEREGATFEWDEDFFFRKWDDEEKELYEELVAMIRKIVGKGKVQVQLDMGANNRWIEYDKQCRIETKAEQEPLLKSLMSKRGHQVLRLVIPYSASVMSFSKDPHPILDVTLEDMNRAINDVEVYFESAKILLEKWRKMKATRLSKKQDSRKYELIEFMTWMTKAGKGYCSATEIKGSFDLSNVSKIIEVLDIGLAKNPKWIEIVVPRRELKKYYAEKKVPDIDKLYTRFKTKAGSSPTVYKVTEEGKKMVEQKNG